MKQLQNTAYKFYSSLGLLIFLNVIIKPVWIFGIDRQVQNVAGTSAYGVYFSLFNLSIVFSFLLDWGITTFFNRQLASQKEKFINSIGNFLLIKLLFALLYSGIIVLVAVLTGIKDWNILINIIFIQVLTSLFLFFRSIVTSQQWFRTDAWLSVLDKTLMILVCGSFLYYPAVFGNITISKFLFAQLASTTLAILCVLVILFNKGISFRISKPALLNKSLLKAVFPFAAIVLLMSVHYRIDGFLLERIHPNGAYEAGIYAGAYRLLDASNMVGFLFASFLLPFIARQWSEKKDIEEVVLGTRHLLLMFSITVASIIFFLAPWVQQVLYHNADSNGITVLRWCLPALIGYSLVQIYGTIMTATGLIIPFCYITIISVILNIFLNFLLIPSFGAKGCCIAALLSQWFCGITSMIYVKQKTGLHFHPSSLLIYIFTGAIISGFLYWSNSLQVSKWLLISAAGIITLLMLIASKLLAVRSWMDSLKKTIE